MDLNLYETHWAAKEELSSNSDFLESIFEMREFVSTPNLSKKFVSQQLSSLKYVFLAICYQLPLKKL